MFNLGTLLNHAGRDAEAVAQFAAAVERAPNFLQGQIALGAVLDRTGDRGGAVTRWLHVADQLATVTGDAIHQRVTALKQSGRVLEAAENLPVAEELLRRCLDVDRSQRDAAAHYVSLRQRQCKWPVVETWGHVRPEDLIGAMAPLALAIALDDPLLQLANAHRYYLSDIARNKDGTSLGIGTAGQWPLPAAPRDGRPLRVGYLSSDLREHAIGFLTASMFGLHDRARVTPIAYYCGIPKEDGISDRIRAGVEDFVDLNGMTDQQAAQRMVDDKIDILVDINGYTRDARTQVIARRPAPIIVNWLGFPGSMGTPDHHYIIADDFIIPPSHEQFYAERVMRLPCYQPNDRHREIAADIPTRAESGLPEDGVVYCCFNGTQKITEPTFTAWMQILRAVPNSVLWLLSAQPDTEARLRAMAAGCGVAPERLVFAQRLRNPWHLARYKLADLFLDTWPYGAHTTASDAMWLGVPLLTFAGIGFAARVCSSLAHAAGLPEMVCADAADYVARAITLGQDRAALADLRARLAAQRETCTLFDTAGLVRHLETLFDTMWDDYAGGRLPVPALANLPMYLEIGMERAQAGRAETSLDSYLDAYAGERAFRHARSPLPLDQRCARAAGSADT
jgi:predicted O-linked N-acetylglucosamine transferase (SPINDLY family)